MSIFQKFIKKIAQKLSIPGFEDEAISPPGYRDFEEARRRLAKIIAEFEIRFERLKTAAEATGPGNPWEQFFSDLATDLPPKGFLLRLREFQVAGDYAKRLELMSVPRPVLKKLAALEGKRFRCEKDFLDQLQKLLKEDALHYLLPILDVASVAPGGGDQNYDLMEGFEILFHKIYQHLETLQQRAGAETQQAAIRQLKKRLLKMWQPFSLRFDAALEQELIRLILDEGEKNPRWILYCIPHLDRFSQAASPGFNKSLRELVMVEIGDLSLGNPSLAQQEIHTLKSIANSQLTLLETGDYRWAHLNIARLLMTKEFIDRVFEEEKTIDEYIDWHIEQAVKADAVLTDLDRLLAAYSQRLKRNYGRVLDLLEAIGEQEDRQLLERKQLLQAIALGELWLNADPRGNAEEAISLLEPLNVENKLAHKEIYLLVKLYAAANRLETAQQEFDRLDLRALKVDITELLNLAWVIRAFDKIEPFLEQTLADNPDSIPLLSRLCELYRAYRNRFADAAQLMARIAQLAPGHPWDDIGRCAAALDENNISEIEKLLYRLPDGNPWDEEAAILKGRLALKTGSADEALAILCQIPNARRVDAQYWQAVTRAHLGQYAEASEAITPLAGDPHFREHVANLQGQLLLAQERYEEALQIFDQLPPSPANFLHKAWACFHLKQFDAVLELVKDEKTEEEIFLKARVYEEQAEPENAARCYKRFLSRALPENHYFPEALNRYTLHVIGKESVLEADWLLGEDHLRNKIPTNRLAHLFILKKAWPEALQVLLAAQGGISDPDSLGHVYQQLLFGYIRESKWENAEETLTRLEELGEQTGEYNRYIARAKLIADFRSDKKRINYHKYEGLQDDLVAIAIALNKYLDNQISYETVLEQIEAWAAKTGQMPEPPLLLLILALLKDNKARAAEYAQSVLERVNGFDDEGLETIARTLASMVIDLKKVSKEDLLNILQRYQDKLPISAKSFWHKIILSVARQDISAARAVLAEEEVQQTLEQEELAAVYARSAFQHLKDKKTDLAMADLEKAIGAP